MDEIDDHSSSTSDDDYIPEVDSEVDGVSEGSATDDDVDGQVTVKQHRKTPSAKRKKHGDVQSAARKKRGDAFQLDDDNGDVKKEEVESDKSVDGSVCGSVDDEGNCKKRADDLWSSFKKDVETTTTTTKSKLQGNESDSTHQVPMSSPTLASRLEKTEPITVTKVYEFAGEEVRVTEKLDASLTPSAKHVVAQPNRLTSATLTSPSEPLAGGTKKLAGLGNILNKLGATKKISTLEKSRLDWNQFKHDEGITEELTTFNKGKEGYLEKQAFLHRADVRQFEIERNLRMTDQSNR